MVRNQQILLVRHTDEGKYDYWSPPGGGVEGSEELAEAAQREVLEETNINVRIKQLAYIDELIDPGERMVKFWFLGEYVSGEIDVGRNPASGEKTSEAGWFTQQRLPAGYVFPYILRDQLWLDLEKGRVAPRKLPLQRSVF